MITYDLAMQRLRKGGMFVTGGGRLNDYHQSHFTSEKDIAKALEEAENDPTLRPLVRLAALPLPMRSCSAIAGARCGLDAAAAHRAAHEQHGRHHRNSSLHSSAVG